jgi:hypothetical protein
MKNEETNLTIADMSRLDTASVITDFGFWHAKAPV